MQAVPSELKVGDLVSLHMPAHRWFMLLGYLDAITDPEAAGYMADFLNEILSAISEAERMANAKADMGNSTGALAANINGATPG